MKFNLTSLTNCVPRRHSGFTISTTGNYSMIERFQLFKERNGKFHLRNGVIRELNKPRTNESLRIKIIEFSRQIGDQRLHRHTIELVQSLTAGSAAQLDFDLSTAPPPTLTAGVFYPPSSQSPNHEGQQVLVHEDPEQVEIRNLFKLLQENETNVNSIIRESKDYKSRDLLMKVTYLMIEKNELTNLPQSIGLLKALRLLMIKETPVTELSDTIGQLSNLKELDIDNNQLSSLPNSIGKLSNLTLLEINNNQLPSLPNSLGQLSNLIELRLNSNQLTSLPNSIGQLSNLTELRLNNNQLTSLPNSIGQLSNLSRLYLENNRLTALPDSIFNLPRTTQISVYNNRFSVQEVTRINHIISRENYAGPRILGLDVYEVPSQRIRPQTLQNSIDFWQKEFSKVELEPSKHGDLSLLKTKDLGHFGRFLSRVQESSDFQRGGKTQRNLTILVYNILKNITLNPEFLDECNAKCMDLETGCGDRVMWALLSMSLDFQCYQLTKLPKEQLFEKAQSISRGYRVLENASKLAIGDVSSYVLLVVLGLKDDLNLPFQLETLRYPSCATVTPEKLAEIKQNILSDDRNNVLDFMFGLKQAQPLLREIIPDFDVLIEQLNAQKHNQLEKVMESEDYKTADNGDVQKALIMQHVETPYQEQCRAVILENLVCN